MKKLIHIFLLMLLGSSFVACERERAYDMPEEDYRGIEDTDEIIDNPRNP